MELLRPAIVRIFRALIHTEILRRVARR